MPEAHHDIFAFAPPLPSQRQNPTPHFFKFHSLNARGVNPKCMQKKVWCGVAAVLGGGRLPRTCRRSECTVWVQATTRAARGHQIGLFLKCVRTLRYNLHISEFEDSRAAKPRAWTGISARKCHTLPAPKARAHSIRGEIQLGGPTGNRTPPSSMPWTRNTTLLWAPVKSILAKNSSGGET